MKTEHNFRISDNEMYKNQLKSAIDELIQYCTEKINCLSSLEVCDIINESQAEPDIATGDKYKELLSKIICCLLKKEKTNFADKLTKLSRESASTKELYEKTRTLLEEIKRNLL